MDIYEWLMFGVTLASFVLGVISTVNATRKKDRIREKKHQDDEEEEIIE